MAPARSSEARHQRPHQQQQQQHSNSLYHHQPGPASGESWLDEDHHSHQHHHHPHHNHQHQQYEQQQQQQDQQQQQQHYSILWVPLVFVLATGLLYRLSQGLAGLEGQNTKELNFPKNMEELTELAQYLSHLKENHWERVLILFIAGYVYKQTFAIPGSVFLNVLSGALFGTWAGFCLTALLSAVGATLCFLLSQMFGRGLVLRWFPDKVAYFQKKTEENRDSLFYYLLFLRLFPMSPNWALNIVSPIVGIPIHLFFFSVFFGLMPYTFVCAQTGSVLSQVTSLNDVLSPWTMASLLVAALVALLPGLLIRRSHDKDD